LACPRADATVSNDIAASAVAKVAALHGDLDLGGVGTPQGIASTGCNCDAAVSLANLCGIDCGDCGYAEDIGASPDVLRGVARGEDK